MARLAAPTAHSDPVKSGDRSALNTRTVVSALVGNALAQAGIDPALAPALRLARHRDPPQASDAREQCDGFAVADDNSLAARFAAKIADMVQRYQDGCELDFGNASLAELFAWSLARPARASARPA
jgi:hypothetical protein